MTNTTSTSTALVVPGSGEIIALDADTQVLAKAVVQLNERIKEVKTDVLAPINDELLARLDRKRQYTLRVDDDVDGTQFELKSTSPDAGTEAYDATLLEGELRALVDRDVIDVEAADAALKRTITLTLQVSLAHDVDKLVDVLLNMKAIGPTPVTVTAAVPGRQPMLGGIARLRKGDGCKAALDRAQLPKVTPARTVKVKASTPKGQAA